jgi:DNA-binding transcriptional LysR family regulator
MDFRYLKAFLLTAKHASFSDAAKELRIAQSAVSRQIKLLEDSLEEELFIRSSKKVVLTHRGTELYLLMKHFDESLNTIMGSDTKKDVKVGILHGLLEQWGQKILSLFYKNYTRNVQIVVDAPEVLQKKIAEGELDVIFSNQNIQSEILSSLKLFTEKLVLISKKPVTAAELHKYRWISYGEDERSFYHLTKKESDDWIKVNSMTTIVSLVKADIGIAIVPDHMVKEEKGLYIKETEKLPKSEIFMTTLSYQRMPIYIEELAKTVKSALPK